MWASSYKHPGQGNPCWEGWPAQSQSMQSIPGQLTWSTTLARTAGRTARDSEGSRDSPEYRSFRPAVWFESTGITEPGEIGSSPGWEPGTGQHQRARMSHSQPASPGNSQGCAGATAPLLLLLLHRSLSGGNNTSRLRQMVETPPSKLYRILMNK